MATAASPSAQRVPTRQRIRNFGRGVTYHIAGLPIAVRGGRGGRSPERVIRRAYSRRYWRPQSWADGSQLALALLFWPFALAGLQIAFTVKNGREIARRGRSIPGQLLDQFRLYLTAGVLPPWYYIFELYRRPETANARDYFYRWESKAGVMPLLRQGARQPVSELNDKARFAAHCRDHQIRTAPVLAVVRGDDAHIMASDADFDTDLFVKPVTGRGGEGAQRWDRDAASGLYRAPDGECVTPGELLGRLRAKSLASPMLVQQRLQNHAALEMLNNGALSTVRVLTCLNEKGQPEIIGAAARMAIGANHVVDNLHAGGIAAAVDARTGTLGSASNLGADARLGWLNRHPVSGALIAGTQLPMWDDVREFAVRAHRAFSDRLLVGWDIAITPEGPVLVEGNGSPDLDIMQRFAGRGLLAGRLGVLLAFHLSQREPASAEAA